MAALLLLSVAQFGWREHSVFFRQIIPAMACGIPDARNASLSTLIFYAFHGRVPIDRLAALAAPIPSTMECGAYKILAVCLYAGILAIMLWRARDARHLVVELLAVGSLSLVLAPVSWYHAYVFAALPLIVLWRSSSSVERAFSWKIALLVVTCVIGTPFVSAAPVLGESFLRSALITIYPFAALGLTILVLMSPDVGAPPTSHGAQR